MWQMSRVDRSSTHQTTISQLAVNPNKFVHLALRTTVALAVRLKGQGVTDALLSSGLQIHILGDNDFYSQRITVRSMESAGPCCVKYRAFDFPFFY
jgi:phosphomevalonate kinase